VQIVQLLIELSQVRSGLLSRRHIPCPREGTAVLRERL
jgi:hypothetical protein